MSYNSSVYTDEQIKYILECRTEGYTWDEISESYNETFDSDKTPNAIRKTHTRFEDYEFTDEAMLTNIRKAHTASKSKSIVAKENKALVEYIERKESLIDEVKALFKAVKFSKPKVVKIKKDRRKRSMTVETMLSDLHYGKLTKHFNAKVSRERMRTLAEATVKDIQKKQKHFNIDVIKVLLIGDIIENAHMHGAESTRSSEFGDAEQCRLAIESLYEDYFVILATLGIPMEVECVTGNHDRIGIHKTFNDPGKESFTWIIYHALEMLCSKSKIKAKFNISDGVYTIYNVYGSYVLVEHGDHIKGGVTEKSCKGHLAKRSAQVGKVLKFLRLGHYHKEVIFHRGEVICNSSMPGGDSYSDINGYTSSASQFINYYVQSDTRPDPYYHSFSVFLGEDEE